jgi:hypothetical protein
MLLSEFAGQTLTVEEIYNRHNVGKPFVEKNYKDALKKMEQANTIRCDPPSTERRADSLGPNVKITFPPAK